MIEIRLAGGLGNQLFQLAAALNVSERCGLPISLSDAYLSSYSTPRKFELEQLLNLNSLGASVSHDVSFYNKFRLVRLLPNVFERTLFISDKNYSSQLKYGKNVKVYMDGYFITSGTQQQFQLARGKIFDALHDDLKNAQVALNVCCIHIRGGDFLKLGWTMSDVESYYLTAVLRILAEKPGVKFLICTDDQKFAKEILSKINVMATINKGGLRSDFVALMTSEYAILSNSTFAFWSGALRFRENLKNTTLPDEWQPNVPRTILLDHEQ